MSFHLRRRTLLAATGAALVGAAADVAPGAATAAAPQAASGFATFRWLGAAGWQIRTSRSHILFDPYLTRFDTGLARGEFSARTSLQLDPSAIDEALGSPRAEHNAVTATLVSHTHWDHFGDVPHIASTRGGTVFTTLTGYHLGQAMGLDPQQLAVVKGGEEVHVGDVVVRVVRSLHSRSGNGGVLFPGLRTAEPSEPATIADLPEGDTLAYLVRSPAGRSVLLLGASDFDDQALRGLRPDVVTVPVPSNDLTADYVERLMTALGRPQTVVPVHWDNFESKLHNPPQVQDDTTADRLHALVEAVRRCSPLSTVAMPRYLEPLRLL